MIRAVPTDCRINSDPMKPAPPVTKIVTVLPSLSFRRGRSFGRQDGSNRRLPLSAAGSASTDAQSRSGNSSSAGTPSPARTFPNACWISAACGIDLRRRSLLMTEIVIAMAGAAPNLSWLVVQQRHHEMVHHPLALHAKIVKSSPRRNAFRSLSFAMPAPCARSGIRDRGEAVPKAAPRKTPAEAAPAQTIALLQTQRTCRCATGCSALPEDRPHSAAARCRAAEPTQHIRYRPPPPQRPHSLWLDAGST